MLILQGSLNSFIFSLSTSALFFPISLALKTKLFPMSFFETFPPKLTRKIPAPDNT